MSRDALTSRPEIERLLEAASGPASPRELAGEHAAADLFARARLVRAATAAETPSRSPRTGLKAAVASVAAVVAMSSGVAFAASGHLPFVGKPKQVTHQVTGQGSDDKADGSQARTPDDGESTTPNGPNAAALPGLCRAYARGQKATHGHALEARPFTALVEAAGGAEQVADFCASLPPTASDHPTPTHPTHPAHPTHGPTALPSQAEPGQSHATDHPTHPVKPTQAPEPTQPSQKPTVTPSHAHPAH
jgi:hypothetical protein